MFGPILTVNIKMVTLKRQCVLMFNVIKSSQNFFSRNFIIQREFLKTRFSRCTYVILAQCRDCCRLKQVFFGRIHCTWIFVRDHCDIFCGKTTKNPLNHKANNHFFSSKETMDDKSMDHKGLGGGGRYPDLSGSTTKNSAYFFCVSSLALI